MKNNSTRAILLIVVILAVGFLSLSPVLSNGFTNWDDNLHVNENKAIENISLDNLKTIFTSYIAGNYYPLTMLTYAIEYRFAGLNPFLYHFDSLILHLFNALLVYWLIYLLSGRLCAAFIGALLFVVHPVNVEAVAWVSSRKDILYCFFYLGGLISYVYYLKEARLKRLYFLTWGLFLFSFLSKPMAASFPFLLFIFDYFYKRKLEKKVFIEKIPFFAVTVVLGIVAYMVQIVIEGPSTMADYSYWERFLFINYGLIAPLAKFIVPAGLSNFYPYTPANDSVLPFSYSISPLLVIFLAIYVLKFFKRVKSIVFGMLFYLATIFFVLRLFPIGGFIMADRYAYVPYIGLFFVVGYGFSSLWQRGGEGKRGLRLCLAVVMAGVTLSFSLLSWQRAQVWKDSLTLWSSALRQYPELIIALQSRANAYYHEAQYDKALEDYNQALKLNAKYEKAYNGRGKVYSQLGKADQAIADFTQAITIKKDYAKAYNNRAAQYYIIEEYDLSLADVEKALKIEPDLPQAYANRGGVFVELKKYNLAEADFEKALSLDLRSREVYSGRGVVYLRTQRLDQAIEDFTKSLSIVPDDADAYYYRGTAYALKGENNLSISDFTKVIGMNNQYLEAYYNRGGVYKRLKQYEQAIGDYTRVLIIDPKYVMAYLKRAEVYTIQNKFKEALDDIENILKVEPGHKEAVSRLQMLKENLE